MDGNVGRAPLPECHAICLVGLLFTSNNPPLSRRDVIVGVCSPVNRTACEKLAHDYSHAALKRPILLTPPDPRMIPS
jgi:hypothetical protein